MRPCAPCHEPVRQPLRAVALLMLAVAPWAAQAQAPGASPASRITQVTVYPGVASVERVARIAAGARSLTFACLPASLDTASLQVQADAAVRVGEFNVQTDDRDVAGGGCTSPLDGRIREVEDQLASVRAEADALALVNSYLKDVAAGSTPEGGTGRPQPTTPAQIAATADALRKSSVDAHTRIHQLKRRQEALELQLKPLVAERDRIASQRARVVSVTVNLAAERDADVRLSYQVRGPGWQPLYRAALDAAKGSVLLERQALVAQSSGEDWSQVQLTLSTGQPGRATLGRQPRPWTLDVAPAQRPIPMAMPAPAAAPAPAMLARRAGADANEAMPSFEISTTDKAFATEFAVPQRITVPSSGQRVTLALGSHTAPAQVFTRAAPAVEEAAYLVADIATPPGVWPAGPASLYRDGAYVGQGRIDFSATTAAPGTGGLSFGRDELVVVRAQPVQDLSSTTGLTGSRTERRTQRKYTLENRHKAAVQLQVLHAAPISRNEKIEVESRYQPAPATSAWGGSAGIVAWQQPLAAGAQLELSAEHVLRYPKDIELQERQ